MDRLSAYKYRIVHHYFRLREEYFKNSMSEIVTCRMCIVSAGQRYSLTLFTTNNNRHLKGMIPLPPCDTHTHTHTHTLFH